MELYKSYRSTIEIAHFAQKTQENKKLIPIERHGDKPSVTICNTENGQFNKIQNLIQQFKQSSYTSLGIICKSQKLADQLYKKVRTVYGDISLLDFNSSEFKDGIIIASVHMSKGLEFDQVIIPDFSDDCYKTQLDRSLLYIACTKVVYI